MEQIRDALTRELELPENDGRTKAVVARELRMTWQQLEALPVGKGVSSVDEVAAKREARRKRASAQGRS